jgi:hypothetical protein
MRQIGGDVSDQPLEWEIVWLVRYGGEYRRLAMPRVIKQFGRAAVAGEFAKQVERGANVVSITRARNWGQPPKDRRPQGPSWAALAR